MSVRRSVDSSSTRGYKPATLTLAEKRPTLPSSTPAPGPSGRANPYSSTTSDQKTLKKSESSPNVMAVKDASLQAARLVLERQCMRLPYDLRENVTTIINSCFSTASSAVHEHDAIQKEIHVLRREAKARSVEIEMLYKRCDKYTDTIKMKEEVIEQLMDEERHNKDHQNKSLRSITRLAKTNRVLIGAFEALGKDDLPVRPKSTASESFQRSRGSGDKRLNGTVLPSLMETGDGNLGLTPPSPATPLTRRTSSAPGDDMGDDDFFDTNLETTKDVDGAQNGKIRACLLRMARDYYKMVKNIDLLNTEVELLSNNLRYSEKRNRQMQLELEELKDNASISSTGSMAAGGFTLVRPESPEGDKSKSKRGATKTLESVDKRLSDLVAKRAFDPLDGIKQMRLMLMHMANAPSSLLQADVADHMCSREVCKIFEVDAICCFVLQPGGETMRKYTSRGVECLHFGLGDGRSVAETVLRNGREVKINSHKSRSKLDPFVDGCETVRTRKLLCVPLTDASNTRVVGCLQFINKYQNFKFSEVDELYAMMFGDLAGSIISSALLFSRVWDRSQILTNILDASTSMFSSMPDAVSLTSAMPLDVDQVLLALEESARRCLNCSKVKAFVASGAVGLEAGSMVALEDDKDDVENKFLKRKHKNGAIYTVFPGMSGIAGMVMRTGQPYLMTSQAADQYHNPQADLNCYVEHGNTPMLSVPIVTLQGESIAVIQLLRGPKSPKLVSGLSSVLTGRVLFEDAARWLSFQLSFSLHHILSHVGRPCFQPTSLPDPLEPMQRINPSSLALKPIAMGGKTSPPMVLENEDALGDEPDDPMARRSSTMEDLTVASPNRSYSSESSALVSMKQRKVSVQEARPEGKTETVNVMPVHTEASPLEASPSKEHVEILQAEIRQLKKTIGRLSTVDLNALRNITPKKTAVPTISEDDDYGSSMGLFFSDEDLDGENKTEELEKSRKEAQELKEDNEHLRSEIESLKELYESARKERARSSSAKPPDTKELELQITERVREELRTEHQKAYTEELEKATADFNNRINEYELQVVTQEKDNSDLKESVSKMTKQLEDNTKQMEDLRMSMTALSIALEAERVKGIEAQEKADDSAPPISQSSEKKDASSKQDTGPAGSSTKSQHCPPSGEAKRSPRTHDGEPAPPPPTEDMVPTSPRLGGWARFVDENNYPYYHNEITGETSWERPEGFPEHEGDYEHHEDAAAFCDLAHAGHHSSHDGSVSFHGENVEGEVRVGDWVQGHDSETGMPYWRNDISGESVWELPPDAHEASVGQLHLDNASYVNSSQASGYLSPIQHHGSVEHQGSVSSIDYGAASAGDYKIEL